MRGGTSAVPPGTVRATRERTSGSSAGGRPSNIVGTPGDDELTGGREPDTFFGLGGDDEFQGSLGRDDACGGGGGDHLIGGPGPTSSPEVAARTSSRARTATTGAEVGAAPT